MEHIPVILKVSFDERKESLFSNLKRIDFECLIDQKRSFSHMSSYSVSELKKTLDHIFYEMMQLFVCRRLLKNMPDSGTINNDEQVTKNCLLESILIHARALQIFFETEKESRRHDDVVSEDYEFDHTSLVYSPETRTRINKEIAHITYQSEFSN